MLKVPFLLLLLPACLCARAQSNRFGNEWIKHGQSYLRIPVAAPGLYRLGYDQLKSAGLPVEAIHPAAWQLFRRGREQALFVGGAADGQFDKADFLEFLGDRNDGVQDSLLYRNGTRSVPSLSLYSDTAVYFLTWTPGGRSGKRIRPLAEPDSADLRPQPYLLVESVTLLASEFSTNPLTGPHPRSRPDALYLAEGEGWTGPVQQKGQLFHQKIRLDAPSHAAGAPVQIEVRLNGRDNTDHLVDGWIEGRHRRYIGSVPFELFQTAQLTAQLGAEELTAADELILTTRSRGAGATDRYSVGAVRLRYARSTDFRTGSVWSFSLPPGPVGRSLLCLTGVPDSFRLFDVTDTAVVRCVPLHRDGDRAWFVIPDTHLTRRFRAFAGPLTPAFIRRVSFRRLDPASADYLLVADEALTKPFGDEPDAVRAYAAYRASAAGGAYDTLLVTMTQLIDQFAYGEWTPLAIRRFADYMAPDTAQKYLLLIGRANALFADHGDPNRRRSDRVPTFGAIPCSDLLLTAGLPGRPARMPAFCTGRLSIDRPEELRAYLRKVMEFEQAPGREPWRRRLLHLSGGRTPEERSAFRQILREAGETARRSYLAATVEERTKTTDQPVEPVVIRDEINAGVSVLTFFGHSSPTVTDLSIGYASEPANGYRNGGRYPLLVFNGCGVGNVFYGGRNVLSTDWLLAPDKGAIAVLAHGNSGYTGPLRNYTRQLYETLFQDSIFCNRPIGQIHLEVTRQIIDEKKKADEMEVSNALQMVLQGDPAIRIFPISGREDCPLTRPPSDSLPVVRVGPNPFSGQMSFRFTVNAPLSRPAAAELLVYTIDGRPVRRWRLPVREGENRIDWDGRDGADALLPAGVYLYDLSLGGGRQSGKLVLLR